MHRKPNNMKKLILFTLLLFPTGAFSQTVSELFLQLPNDVLEVTGENRRKLVTQTDGDLLKFRLSEIRQGEIKIVSRKQDEILLGMSISNCDESDLRFWTIKKSVWKETTTSVIKPLGKNDLTAILKASPATVSQSNQSIGIATFYKFAADSNLLQLFARKQDSCEVAGKIYDYTFSGKKFTVKK
jgi:hypothetical protein